jgi:putative nucleotidyltransferase with HDIG domain
MRSINDLRIRILKKAYNVGIATKIIVPFVVLALFIALVGGYTVSMWIAGMLNTSAERELMNSRKSADSAFMHYEAMMSEHANYMASVAHLDQSIEMHDETELRALLLPMMIASNSDFFEVLDKNGNVMLNNNGPFSKDTDLNGLYIVQGAKSEIRAVDLLNTPAGYVIAGIAPVKKTAGDMVGFVICGNYFTNGYLRNINTLVGREISVFTQEGLIATTKEGNFQTACLASGCHRSGYTNLISTKILHGNIQRIEFADMLGETYMITHNTLKLHGQPVAFYSILMPMGNVIKTQNAIRGVILLAALLLIIMITTIGFIIGKNISEPIEQLSILAKRVTRGDLTQRASYIGTKDEVGELSISFNQMTESLQRYTKSLRRRVQELSVLYDTSVNISSIYDMSRLEQMVVDNAALVLNADSGYILTSEEKSSTLVLMAGYGVAETMIKNVTVDINTAITAVKSDGIDADESDLNVAEKRISIGASAVLKGLPELIDRSTIDDDDLRQLFAASKTGSVLVVPLRIHDTMGMIMLCRSDTKATFTSEDRDFVITLANQAAAFLENRMLIENLRDSYIATVRALAEAIDAKDSYTRGHSTRVAQYAVAIAHEMGLTEKDIEGLETAAYLHDVGKIGISDQILLKPDRLTLEELETVKSHPIISARILAPIKFPWEIIPIVSQHHERYSGDGYPQQLKESEIHIGARILIVADAFEAMTSDRPYRPALSRQAAIDELKKERGAQFDPMVVDTFIAILEREKSNSKKKKNSKKPASGKKIIDLKDRRSRSA